MKVLNNITIDFGADYERVYELTIECRDEDEVKVAMNKVGAVFTVDNFDDLEVTVIAQAWKYQTKKDFIKEVKILLKK